jgi:hypothetical protein
MSSARTLFVAALVVATPPALSACKTPKDTNAPLASDGTGPGDTTDTTATRTPTEAGDPVQVNVSVEAVDDIMAGVKKMSESWMPGTAVDPAADAQAMLLAIGFGPGFWGNIDFSAKHAVWIAGSNPDNMQMAGSLAVIDGKKLLDSTPPDFRPQPLGEGMYELTQDGERMLLRDAGKELLFGYTTEDIDRASKLRAKIGEGRRFRARATDIPVDEFDPIAALDLPRGVPWVDALAEVLRELEAAQLEVDFGTDRDAELVASAQAPFHKLGLGPIGKPRAAATGLEGKLPGDPVFVAAMSWGDPALVHTVLDKTMPPAPPPFDKMAKQAIDSMHIVLDQVKDDFVIAMYVDNKGRSTLVMAADVKDEAKTLEGVRGLNDVIVQGVDAQKMLAGKNTAQAFDAKLGKDKVKLGKAKADLLTITIPKTFEEDFEPARSFLLKNKLESYTMVTEGTAVIAIGAGAKSVISDVGRSLGKARRDSLAQDEGLGRLRKAMGGCQICVSGDPMAYFTFRLQHLRDTSEDKNVVKDAKAKLAEVGKLDALGAPGLGVKVADTDASLAVVVPQTLLFAAPKTSEMLLGLVEFLDGGGSSIEEAPERPSKK